MKLIYSYSAAILLSAGKSNFPVRWAYRAIDGYMDDSAANG